MRLGAVRLKLWEWLVCAVAVTGMLMLLCGSVLWLSHSCSLMLNHSRTPALPLPAATAQAQAVQRGAV